MPDRIIRESSCTSETLNQLSDFEERFWWRLVVNCDDFGRFDARPAILKSRLFPLSDGKTYKDMQNALSALASVGLVKVYRVDGRPFLQLVKWSKYQRIRAEKSKFPSPDEACSQLSSIDSECPRIRNAKCEMRNAEANAGAPARDSAFDAFWEEYPKNSDRKRAGALSAWGQLNPNEDGIAHIMSQLRLWKQSERWLEEDGRYIPKAEAFLDPKGEYLTKKPASGKPGIPMGATGELGEAELAAIQRVLREDST